MPLAILFHFLCTQNVSDINISIIRNLRLFCWITTLVYCSWFDVCWSFGVVGLEWYPCCRLQPATRTPIQTNHTRNSSTHRTKNNTTNVVIQQNSRKFLMMEILMSETFWVHKKWNKIASGIKLVFYSWTITMTHGPINIILPVLFIYPVRSMYQTCLIFLRLIIIPVFLFF